MPPGPGAEVALLSERGLRTVGGPATGRQQGAPVAQTRSTRNLAGLRAVAPQWLPFWG